jgi:hypothetical protein
MRSGTTANPIGDTMEVSWILKTRNENCVTLYSECGFKGTALPLCKSIPSTPNTLYKSIYVP